MPVLQEYDLSGKVAIVAGGGDSHTLYLAQALAEAHARIFVLNSSRSIMEEGIRRVKEIGGQAIGEVGDCTVESAVELALERLMARWGQVDVLVNDFRTPFARPLAEMTVDDFEEVIKRNVKPLFLLCRAVGKRMLKNGGGRIVNITSGLAERGLRNSTAYCASQGAVLQLTRALALEWARSNIRVNAIGTGWFSTEELAPEEAQKELLVRYIPLRRKGHPRDIGPLLVLLASDASDYTTGQPIYVDGGLMARP